MLQVWQASRDARALASYPDAQALAPSITSFHNTFDDFVKLCDRSGSPIEARDHFFRTWDECDDFLHDYDAIQNGATKLRGPRPCRGARYVYTELDVKDFGRRVGLLLYIMQAKMDDILLKQLMHIYTTTEANPDTSNEIQGRLLAQQVAGPSPGELDKDESILPLYDFLEGINYQLKRTGTLVASPGDMNAMRWSFSHADIEKICSIWILLRTRFREHHIQSRSQSLGLHDIISPTLYDKQDEKRLQEFSIKKLDGLEKEFRIFRAGVGVTTRKRVYGNITVAESSIPDLSLPGPALGEEEATITIPGTSIDKVPILSIDVVNRPKDRLVVCCLERNNYTGTLHFLPPITKTYPYTYYNGTKPLVFNSEVSIHESQICKVSTILRRHDWVEHKHLIPLYNFPVHSDLTFFTTFQTTLKEKHLCYTFQMYKISSYRGDEALKQPLKLWMDPDDKSYTISFLQHRQPGPVGHLEFALSDFTRGHLGTHFKEPSIQIMFRGKTRPRKKRSHGSLDRSLRRLSSSSLANLGSLVNRRRSSASSNASEDVLRAADPPSQETNPQSPTEGENESEDMMAVTSVHPLAEPMKFLNLTFSNENELTTFKSKYTEIMSERKDQSTSLGALRSAGRANSTFQSRHTSPLIEDEESTPASFQEFQFPQTSGTNSPITGALGGGEKDRTQVGSHATPSPTRNDAPKDATVPLNPPVVGMVYRVKGIPEDYGNDKTTTMLKELLKIDDDTTKIKIRTLATSEHYGEKVSVVQFMPEPRELASGEHWFFNYGDKPDGGPIDITIDTHFRGLTVLTSPSNGVHKLDICTVSGLGGHAFGSFKKRSAQGGTWMWILDTLKSIPKLSGCRLLLYGSDTKLAGNNSTQELSSLGQELRSSLQALRSTTATDTNVYIMPLIFIAHSLGGLVVREALNYAIEHPKQCDEFLRSIHGALFFGVPNQGMKNQALEEIVGAKPNAALVVALREDGDTVRNQTFKFKEVMESRDLDMFYFYEEEETSQTVQDESTGELSNSGPKLLLVTKSSATNGLINTNDSVTHGIKRNHSEIVKFSKHDGELLTVVGVLVDMVERALKRGAGEPFETPLMEGSRQKEFPSPGRTGTDFSQFRPSERSNTGLSHA